MCKSVNPKRDIPVENGDGRLFPTDKLYCEGRLKPMFRGYIHACGSVILTPLIISFLQREVDVWIEYTALTILVAGFLICWGASALFHIVPWSVKNEIRMQKIDHSAIFLNIATCYTAIAALIVHKYKVPDAWFIYNTMGIVWCACGLGMWHVFNRHGGRMKYWVTTIAMTFPSYFVMSSYLTVLERGYTIFSLCVYGIGAIIFSKKLCNFIPHIFGHHEVFHLFTIVAGIQGYLLFESLSTEEISIRCNDSMNSIDMNTGNLLWRGFVWIITHTFTTMDDICSSSKE